MIIFENNSSKDDPYVNMFGWELSNLHNMIYGAIEWNARVNIGIYVRDFIGYDDFNASKYWGSCGAGGNYRVKLNNLMFSNGFCEIFSNAGEQGYDDAYDVIQKWCN